MPASSVRIGMRHVMSIGTLLACCLPIQVAAQEVHCVSARDASWFRLGVHPELPDALVVWTDHSVHLTRDGGLRWQDWSFAAGVDTAALGRLGSLFVVSDGRLETLTARGERRSTELPFAGGSDLVVQRGFAMFGYEGGVSMLHTSQNGRDWRSEETDQEYYRYLDLRSDGSLEILGVEVNTCSSSDTLQYIERRTRPPGEVDFVRGRYPIGRSGGATVFQPGAHGAVYAFDRLTRHVVTTAPSAVERVGHAFPGRSPDTLFVHHNRRITLALFAGMLLRLEGRQRRTLSSEAPEAVSQLVVDGRGRALASTSDWVEQVQERAVFRFERASGWRQLVRSCEAPRAPPFPAVAAP